jgi:hypothetical protein
MARLLGAAVVLFAAAAHGHPGVGIVQDSRGNVFFTDLKQVWKIAHDEDFGRSSQSTYA